MIKVQVPEEIEAEITTRIRDMLDRECPDLPYATQREISKPDNPIGKIQLKCNNCGRYLDVLNPVWKVPECPECECNVWILCEVFEEGISQEMKAMQAEAEMEART